MIVGILVEIITYVPLLLLVFLFRRTSARKIASKKLKYLIESLTTNQETKKKIEIKSSKDAGNRNKDLKFPWWLKIILYLFSFMCMGVSIALILIKSSLINFNLFGYIRLLVNKHYNS